MLTGSTLNNVYTCKTTAYVVLDYTTVCENTFKFTSFYSTLHLSTTNISTVKCKKTH